MGYMHILGADIGATNARIGWFRATESGALTLTASERLAIDRAASFADLMGQLEEIPAPFRLTEAEGVCLAVPGPMRRRGRYTDPPNIPWDMDLDRDAPALGHAVMINDFVAQAYACATEMGERAAVVLRGSPPPAEDLPVRAVVGAGTGFGKAALLPDGHGGFVPMPSEGGHVAFAFLGSEEHEFERFIIDALGVPYVTLNEVMTGAGLALLHRFLTGAPVTPRDVVGLLSDESETVAWFARFYGRVARDFALETLALGGLYVAGGVAARTPALVTHPGFEREFRSSPAHGDLLARIPVRLIADDASGLWGAARRALMEALPA